jgi:hypothetical protein
MRVILRKPPSGDRALLSCVRADGSYDHSRLGPGLAAHDLAHLAVESRLALAHGFFGRLAAGSAIEQLQQPDVPQPPAGDWLLAEVAARALQSWLGGACTAAGIGELVRAEMRALGRDQAPFPPGSVDDLAACYRWLLERWQALPPSADLELRFPLPWPPAA